MKDRIQIGIPCGPNGEDFTVFLIESIEHTISGKYGYDYILGINQNGVRLDYLKEKLSHLADKISVVLEAANMPYVSGHGHCLNLLLKNMTSKFGMFVDTDVAFLTKDWDTMMIEKINEKVIIVGSEYHPTDKKIVNFPNAITCLFDVEKLKKLNVDFIPKLKWIETRGKDAEYYGTKEGDKIYLDTGCHVAKDIRSNGFDGYCMKIVTPRYEDRIGDMKFMKVGMRGEAYQLDGIPICTHIGRSLSRSFESDPIITKWRNDVENWKNGNGKN